MENNTKKFISGIIILIIGGVIIWATTSNTKVEEKSASEAKQDTRTSREVALTCTTDMATEFHIHPELMIVINGKEELVPQNLGVGSTCMTAIHTHGEKNVLHVEAPVQKDFTLGDFFAVWKKDFSKTKLLDNVVDDKSEIVVSVNGQIVDTYENTILRDKDKIVISYQAK